MGAEANDVIDHILGERWAATYDEVADMVEMGFRGLPAAPAVCDLSDSVSTCATSDTQSNPSDPRALQRDDLLALCDSIDGNGDGKLTKPEIFEVLDAVEGILECDAEGLAKGYKRAMLETAHRVMLPRTPHAKTAYLAALNVDRTTADPLNCTRDTEGVVHPTVPFVAACVYPAGVTAKDAEAWFKEGFDAVYTLVERANPEGVPMKHVARGFAIAYLTAESADPTVHGEPELPDGPLVDDDSDLANLTQTNRSSVAEMRNTQRSTLRGHFLAHDPPAIPMPLPQPVELFEVEAPTLVSERAERHCERTVPLLPLASPRRVRTWERPKDVADVIAQFYVRARRGVRFETLEGRDVLPDLLLRRVHEVLDARRRLYGALTAVRAAVRLRRSVAGFVRADAYDAGCEVKGGHPRRGDAQVPTPGSLAPLSGVDASLRDEWARWRRDVEKLLCVVSSNLEEHSTDGPLLRVTPALAQLLARLTGRAKTERRLQAHGAQLKGMRTRGIPRQSPLRQVSPASRHQGYHPHVSPTRAVDHRRSSPERTPHPRIAYSGYQSIGERYASPLRSREAVPPHGRGGFSHDRRTSPTRIREAVPFVRGGPQHHTPFVRVATLGATAPAPGTQSRRVSPKRATIRDPHSRTAAFPRHAIGSRGAPGTAHG
eukprot:TRINITY_DN21159_c0_g1_i1.p1 TRINITY_DN21159_c0_g1~~TRINITY_DN21159_c0_g1_i1.p1  ORF type:complete len:659 (+),score=62.39 TRINITY_DN21159_c0_g1_i1:125-2101(+)